MLQICQGFSPRMRGDSDPCLDSTTDSERNAPTFIDYDSRDGLTAAIVHAVPFAGGSSREQNVGASAPLNVVPYSGTLFLLEHLALGRQDGDDRSGEARARQVFG